jgi:hypothetical protein
MKLAVKVLREIAGTANLFRRCFLKGRESGGAGFDPKGVDVRIFDWLASTLFNSLVNYAFSGRRMRLILIGIFVARW